MRGVSTAEARKELAHLIDKASHGKERVRLTRHGRTVAVLVPLEDVEALEDAKDAAEARKVLRAMRARKEEQSSWSSRQVTDGTCTTGRDVAGPRAHGRVTPPPPSRRRT